MSEPDDSFNNALEGQRLSAPSADLGECLPPFGSAKPAKSGAAEPPKSGKGKKSGCAFICCVILLLFLLISLAVNCFFVVDKAVSGSSSASVDTSSPNYTYKLIRPRGDSTVKAKIVVLPIEGVISSDRGDGVGAFSTPNDLRSALDFLSQDEDVAALVLEVNSPGGGLTASDIMLHYLLDFKAKAKVPVYAYFMDEACSGGYYVSMASDSIYACPTVMTGSIGVIMQLPEISELMNKMGVKMVTIASLNSEGRPSYKDIGSMFRTMKPDERAMLQALITESWQRFVKVVSDGRKGKLTKQQVEKLADGRIFSAQQALKANIIDGICYPDELYAKITEKLEKSGINEPRAVLLTRETSLLDDLNIFKICSMLPLYGRAQQFQQPALPRRYYQSSVDGVMY
ncbi:signal peptide peptidase SppA [bacterium]|nr:signal peptide peptidase SppA [bacterium]